MASVTVNGLVKRYGHLEVLKDITLDVRDGEFVALVGPSGCGKSTLLRILAGLDASSEGRIAIGGRDVGHVHPKDRDIAMVFQSYALYPHMTVAENLGFALKLAGVSKEVISQKVSRAAEILHLETLLARYPRELSGGQRQRVAMGRAIVRDPKVFLFDEPLSNLDAKLRVVMRAEIKELQQRLKATAVYVTHDQIEAMTMADRIVVMNGGKIEQFATPLELYDRPANIFVASFIGSPQMNLVAASISSDGLKISTTHMLPPNKHAHQVSEGDYVVGIRPEDITLSDTQGIPVRVTVVEPTGSHTMVHGRTETGDLMLASLPGRVDVRPGEQRCFAIDFAKVHLFHADSGSAVSPLAA
jgi:multiple sugar transport system ATP-binding protein